MKTNKHIWLSIAKHLIAFNTPMDNVNPSLEEKSLFPTSLHNSYLSKSTQKHIKEY